MNNRQQTRVVELKRRIKMCVAALKAVEQCLDLDHSDRTLSPDSLAESIRHATAQACSKD